MKSLPVLAALALVGLGAHAHAATPSEMARLHIDAIAGGDVAKITSQYGAATSLNWVGGPLNGTYIGPEQLSEVWGKFAKAMAPLKATVGDIRESGNPAGTTVTADVSFAGKSTIKVRYIMLYRGDQLIDEVWQIDPKAAY